ncbi:MAG: LLM class flavin-dependent oxidoreductase, partial [Chloroflexota bacterium]
FLKIREKIRSDPFRVGGLDTAAYDQILGAKRWIIGSPDTVVRDLREVLARLRPGILAIWTNDGTISHEDSMRCLELMGQEVLPALREIGEELELTDPFQKAP